MKRIYLSTLALFANALLFAQDQSTNVHTEVTKTSNTTTFWGQPWVWVLGAAIFILLLVALMRGGSSSRQ